MGAPYCVHLQAFCQLFSVCKLRHMILSLSFLLTPPPPLNSIHMCHFEEWITYFFKDNNTYLNCCIIDYHVNTPSTRQQKTLFFIVPYFFEHMIYVESDSVGAFPSVFCAGRNLKFTPFSASQGKYIPLKLIGAPTSLQPAELLFQEQLLDTA